MNQLHIEHARQIVADVLLLNRPVEGSAFRMYAVDPENLLGADRIQAARRWASLVPMGTTTDNAETVVATIAAMLADGTPPPPMSFRLQTGNHVPNVRAEH